MSLIYKVKYKILDPNLIFNYIGPSVGYHRNPQRKQLTENRINQHNIKNNFYNNLEESILCEGFRNPIIINAGWISGGIFKELPDNVQAKGLANLLICYQLGGSRLYVAQKYNIPIPCIIKDFVDKFNDCSLIDSEESVRKLYKDQPISVECNGTFISISWSNVKI